MTGYTNPLLIPYATSGDSLRDAVSTIPQQAAEKVDDLLTAISGVNPAGPVAITPSPNWINNGSAVYRRAGFAHAHLSMNRDQNSAWGGSTNVGVIPAGYRPLVNLYVAAVVTNSGAPTMVLIAGATGLVSTVLGQPAGSGGLILDCSYAI